MQQVVGGEGKYLGFELGCTSVQMILCYLPAVLVKSINLSMLTYEID